MKKNFSVMLVIIFCALLVKAQDAPPVDAAPAQMAEPTEHVESTPPPDIEAPAPEVAQPETQTMAPAALPKKKAHRKTVRKARPVNLSPDDPDSHTESEFHRIYKAYNEEPTSEVSWEKALGERNSEVYKVQKGDTLSGVSTTLFGDQFFWPKVWSLNADQILNPHEISPGMGVQFFPGSMSDAPTLAVGAKADEKVTSTSIPVPVAPPKGSMDGIEIPPPKKRAPLVEKLPNSLPGSRLRAVQKTVDDVRVELTKHVFPKAFEYLDYYINDAPIAGDGQITGTELGMGSAGEFQYIYVRLSGSTEKNFVVQKNLTLIEDPRSKGRKAQMVQIQGAVQILEKVNDAENIYRAMVTKTIHPVEVGSVLTPGSMPMIDPSGGAPTSGVGGTIMGGQFEKKRELMGQNSLVFLDTGSSQGLQVGQTLSIFADERVRNKKVNAVSNDRVIGSLKIVRVTNNFATAYVTKAIDDVLVGDYAGKMISTASHAVEEVSEPVSEEISEPASEPAIDDSSVGQPEDDMQMDDVAPDSGSEDSELEL